MSNDIMPDGQGSDLGTIANEIHFGARLVAILIDGIIVSVFNNLILFPVLGFSLFSVLPLISIAVWAAYNGFMFASEWQATLGKKIVGLYVVNEDGSRLNLQQGFIRGAAMWLSGVILFLGYLMPFFTPERKTLHDRLCRTRVAKGHVSKPLV